MRTNIKKWGNSLALRIPKSFAQEVGVACNMSVDMQVEDGKLIVVPLKYAQITLERLLEQITEDNIHGEVDTGTAIGNEVW